jgi:hypothetical protein
VQLSNEQPKIKNWPFTTIAAIAKRPLPVYLPESQYGLLFKMAPVGYVLRQHFNKEVPLPPVKNATGRSAVEKTTDNAKIAYMVNIGALCSTPSPSSRTKEKSKWIISRSEQQASEHSSRNCQQ